MRELRVEVGVARVEAERVTPPFFAPDEPLPMEAASEIVEPVGTSLTGSFTLSNLWRTAVARSAGTVARGAIWGLVITVGGVGLGMLSQVALARQLGTGGYG